MAEQPGLIEGLQRRLQDRIRVYEEVHDCHESDEATFDSAENVTDAVHSAIMFAWPYSAYIILRSVSWTVVNCQFQGWWSEVSVLMDTLSVHEPVELGAHERWVAEYGEESASRMRKQDAELKEIWTRIFQGWPKQDWLLIRDWLMLASQWEFVKELYSSEAQAAISFWSQRG